MIRVTVHYRAQLRRAAGRATETVTLTDGTTLVELLRTLSDAHDPAFRRLLLADDDRPQESLLVFVGDDTADAAHPLHDGADVTLLTPMAGG